MTVELSCDQCRDYLIEFTAGSLLHTNAEAVRQHLTTCAACQRELAEWRMLADAMGMRDRQTPLDLGASSDWTRLEAALPAQRSSDARQDRWGNNNLFQEKPTSNPAIASPAPTPPIRRRSSQARSRLVPAIAAMLLISLGAAIFGVLAYHNRARPPQVTQRSTCVPSQISAQLPKGSELHALAMTAPDEGWVVGSHSLPGGPAISLILHYSHCRWTPEPVQLQGVALYLISAISADDVWAFGIKLTPAATNAQRLTGVIVHYTGGQWQESPLPISVADDQIVMGFSMVSSDEGWIHVAQRNAKYGWGPPYQLYHGVNGIWSLVSAPGYQDLWLVKAFAPGEAWLTAEQESTSPQQVLMLYRNGTLTPMYTLPPKVFSVFGRQIQLDGPQDAWVTAQTFTTQGTPSGWLLLHCTFSSCSQSSLLDDSRIQSSDVVQVFSANEGWAFRVNQPTPSYPTAPRYSIFRLRSGQWQRMPTSLQLYPINDIEQVTPDEYWVCTTTALLHFANGSWSKYS